jgi:hypothetical protein
MNFTGHGFQRNEQTILGPARDLEFLCPIGLIVAPNLPIVAPNLPENVRVNTSTAGCVIGLSVMGFRHSKSHSIKAGIGGPRVNFRLRPKLLAELKPGTRGVSHTFDLGDWKPLKTGAGHWRLYLSG